MDKHDEELAELLWRHIVDVKYGQEYDLDGHVALATVMSDDLRELVTLVDDVHVVFMADPSNRQAAARRKFSELLSRANRSTVNSVRHSVWRTPLRFEDWRRRPTVIATMILLLLLAAAALTANWAANTEKCNTVVRARPAPTRPGQP